MKKTSLHLGLKLDLHIKNPADYLQDNTPESKVSSRRLHHIRDKCSQGSASPGAPHRPNIGILTGLMSDHLCPHSSSSPSLFVPPPSSLCVSLELFS